MYAHLAVAVSWHCTAKKQFLPICDKAVMTFSLKLYKEQAEQTLQNTEF
jgi:hypothetical protein